MFTHTRDTWYGNRDSRAWAHSCGAAVSIEQLAVFGERAGKRVAVRGDVKGMCNVVESMGKGVIVSYRDRGLCRDVVSYTGDCVGTGGG